MLSRTSLEFVGRIARSLYLGRSQRRTLAALRQQSRSSLSRAINQRHSHRTKAHRHRAQVPERDRMKKEMLINVQQPEECRIAIVEDGILEELYVERTSHESYTGNIYKGRSSISSRQFRRPSSISRSAATASSTSPTSKPQYFDRASTAEVDPEVPRQPIAAAIRAGRRPQSRPRPPAPPTRPEPVDPSFGPPLVDPLRSDPLRSEPLRSEPLRSEPLRSEPLRSEPLRSDRRLRSDPLRSDPLRSEPPLNEDRYPERPRDRDRDRKFPRERERPDQSVKGRRDRSEPPPRSVRAWSRQTEPWPEPEPLHRPGPGGTVRAGNLPAARRGSRAPPDLLARNEK